MKRLYPLKIDIASHILPTKYKKAIDEIAPGHVQQDKNNMLPTLWDLDQRFKIMDIYEVMHVLVKHFHVNHSSGSAPGKLLPGGP